MGVASSFAKDRLDRFVICEVEWLFRIGGGMKASQITKRGLNFF